MRVESLGEPSAVLTPAEVRQPQLQTGDVLVRVRAVSLNFPDVLLCRGQYQDKPDLPFTPGLEVSGEVLEAPSGSVYVAGDRVIALPRLPDGGLAEVTIAPLSDVFPMGPAMSWADGCVLPIAYQTAHLALHHRAHIRPGETLLVHGAAGGVGVAAIQLGKAAGARVIATAAGIEKNQVCREQGADLVIDYGQGDFVDAVKEFTEGRGADVIFDPVGGEVFDRSRKCIAFEGRLLIIGFAGGSIPQIPANHLLIKNYSTMGVYWGLYRQLQPSTVAGIHLDLVRLHAEGKVRPLIFDEVPLERAGEGLQLIADRKMWGKIVVNL